MQGKDRTGVVCAVAQRLAGVSRENITADHLAYNAWCARDIAVDAERLGRGMTRFEKAILMSFLEARKNILMRFGMRLMPFSVRSTSMCCRDWA